MDILLHNTQFMLENRFQIFGPLVQLYYLNDRLYEKGALILCDLEEKIGTDKFLDFLSQVSSNKIHATDQLLELAEKQLNSEIAFWLESQLRER